MHAVFILLSATSMGYAYDNGSASSFCSEMENCCSCETPCCEGTGFLTAELLYWRAFEGGLDACFPSEVSDRVTSDGRIISRFKGKGKEPHFDWNPGFRIGTGYEFACSNWEVAALWTHFYSNMDRSKNGGNRPRWRLKLDVIDVVAVYGFEWSSCFTLWPYAGLRGAYIDQKVHNNGECYGSRCSSYSYESNDLIRGKNRNKQRFEGIGPLIGLEGDWWLVCGFSLYANASVSWLYGRSNAHFFESDGSSYIFNSSSVKKGLDACLACADAAIGIRWQTCICRNMRLILQLGLEHHRYFNYNRIGGYGDLCFDGLNFGGGIEF
jgi:hypothetical protein